MLDAIGSTYTEESVDMMFVSQGKSADTDSLSYDQVFEAIEAKIKDATEITRRLLEDTSVTRRAFRSQSVERLIQIRQCPLCKKSMTHRIDLDVLSHIAMCTLDDPSKLDNFGTFFTCNLTITVLGGFLTESYASRKWFTKIINRVTYGSYSSGKNNGLSFALSLISQPTLYVKIERQVN